MKLIAYILVGLGVSLNAMAYEDFVEEVLVECTAVDYDNKIVLYAVPGQNQAVAVKVNPQGKELRKVKGEYSISTTMYEKSVHFKSKPQEKRKADFTYTCEFGGGGVCYFTDRIYNEEAYCQ